MDVDLGPLPVFAPGVIIISIGGLSHNCFVVAGTISDTKRRMADKVFFMFFFVSKLLKILRLKSKNNLNLSA